MPTATWIALATTTLASATNTVTFSSIPATYRDLVLVIEGETAASTRPSLRLNGDTGSNYSSVIMATDTPPYSTTATGTLLDPMPGYAITGKFMQLWNIMDAGASDKHKTILARTNIAASNAVQAAGRYASNTAITSVTALTNDGDNYSIGTVMSLYGIVS